jgi:hypothetical protein
MVFPIQNQGVESRFAEGDPVKMRALPFPIACRLQISQAK